LNWFKIYVNHHYGISLFVFLRGLFGETPAPTLVYLSGWCMMFDAVRGKTKKRHGSWQLGSQKARRGRTMGSCSWEGTSFGQWRRVKMTGPKRRDSQKETIIFCGNHFDPSLEGHLLIQS
jgi:urease accessory protein UreF